MSVMLAGLRTGASATPSTLRGHSVEAVVWECTPFILSQTGRDSRLLIPAMTPTASEVDRHLDKVLNTPILSLVGDSYVKTLTTIDN